MTRVDEFIQVLVAEMEADQSTSLVDSILKDARAALKAGKGTLGSLTASAVNGKSFTRTVDLSPVQVIDACRQALKIYLSDGEDDDRVSATYPDFGGIVR